MRIKWNEQKKMWNTYLDFKTRALRKHDYSNIKHTLTISGRKWGLCLILSYALL